MDAEQLRARFHEHLQKHPPAVRRILALDPTLLASQSRLAAGPGQAVSPRPVDSSRANLRVPWSRRRRAAGTGGTIDGTLV
jgi:hypothetical protein